MPTQQPEQPPARVVSEQINDESQVQRLREILEKVRRRGEAIQAGMPLEKALREIQ